jgi:hypothetical protein
MMVLRKMMELADSERDIAVSWLLIGAIFFAMRSCEYLQTSVEEKKRTRIVRIGNIQFKKGNRLLQHSNPDIVSADLVRIRFTYQKNDKRDVCIHMFRSQDPILCPVVAWANTVMRVLKIPSADKNSEVCLFQISTSQTTLLRADHIRLKLRAIVELIGSEVLGFTKDEIGLHSIRSGGAMAMFLSGTSVIIIMRVGRWSSEAFLEYIRDQVENFTYGVSKRMLSCEEFFNLNLEESTSSHEVIQIDDDDKNEDGPNSVPFCIKFNKIALGGENRTE